jgi:HEAT repeat protein
VTKWVLTPEVKDLLERLYLGAIQGKRDRASALRRIGELGTPAAIPRLAAFLIPSKRREASAALQAIANLLDRVHLSDLRRLDLEVRRQAQYWGFGILDPGFGRLDSKDVARLRKLSSEPLATAAICSMHRSGYVREAAVRELAQRQDALELPYLLLRAADWVPEVRELALEAVRARLKPSYIPALVSCLALVEGESFAAGRASAVGPAIDALLSDPRTGEVLLRGLTGPDRPTRRAAARRLAELRSVPIARFLDTALRQDDVVVTTLAAESAVRALKADELQALLQRLRIGRLRQIALWSAITRFPGMAEELLREALFDRQGGVRDIAQRELASRGVDVPGTYREALPRDPMLALLGLSEVGTKTDAGLALPFLEADAISLRRAAIRAIGRLDTAGNRDGLLAGITDSSPSVSREALRSLEDSPGAVADRVWKICLEAPEAHVRANCFRLFASLGKWELLRWGLMAALRPEPEIAGGGRSLVKRFLVRWNSSFTTPSPQLTEEIASLMPRATAALDRKTIEDLQFTLKSYVSREPVDAPEDQPGHA